MNPSVTLAHRIRATSGPLEQDTKPPGSQGTLLTRALIGPIATLSLGAAAIHFAVIPQHFAEWWGFAVLFAAIGWFQALWPIAYIREPSRRVAVVAIVVNLATVIVWALSRTIGLPIGPEPGIVESVGWPDLVSSAFEVTLVAGLMAGHVALPGDRGDDLPRSADVSHRWTVGLAVAVAVASTLAITIGMGVE